jgi:hypothetical protein
MVSFGFCIQQSMVVGRTAGGGSYVFNHPVRMINLLIVFAGPRVNLNVTIHEMSRT